jgi:anti-sigma28 factor (negative regulator of flagellin synthesis)
MKVDDPNPNGVASAQTGRTPEAHEANRVNSTSGARISESTEGDRAEISSLAGRISQAFAAHAAQRTQQISKLTEDYRAGKYDINARSISQAITRDALERKTDGSR